MSNYGSLFNRGYLVGVKASDHSPLTFDYDTTNGWGTTIPDTGVYYFPLGGSEMAGGVVETVVHSLSARWSAALAGTLSIEGTNFPRTFSGFNEGAIDVADDDESGAWQPIDITLAGMLYASIAGTDNALTKLTATIGGTHAGFALWNLPDLGVKRLRAKLDLSAAGFVSLCSHAKHGS